MTDNPQPEPWRVITEPWHPHKAEILVRGLVLEGAHVLTPYGAADELNRLEAKLKQALEALRAVEYVGLGRDGDVMCPICWVYYGDLHSADCSTGAALSCIGEGRANG